MHTSLSGGNHSTDEEQGTRRGEFHLLAQLYDLLAQIGLRYRASATNTDMLRAWLRLGYPVIVACAESSIHDLMLADGIPYPWHPSGNHIIVLTGVTPDDNFLARDSANVTDLYDPNSLRPGPRRYDAAKLQLISATVIFPTWLPVPPDGFDPLKETFVPVVPPGWHDDGTTLTAPNGHKVVRGFREYILANHWHPANMPLEEEQGRDPLEESNPALGGGTQQVFNWTDLEWTPARGVFVAWMGQELLRLRADKVALLAQIANLEAQLNR